jgi:hypothetical protein
VTAGLVQFVRVVLSDDRGVAVESDALDADFRIDKSRKRDPDSAEVTLYNAGPTTRGFANTEAEVLEVYAGREEPAKLVFKGEITDVVDSRSDDFIDRTLVIYAEDNKSTLRTRIVSRTYASGTNLRGAFSDLASAAEMQLDYQGPELFLPSPMTFLGPPREGLRDLSDRFGLRYQIVDRRIMVRLEDGPVSASIPLVSSQTGLLGVPQPTREKKGSKFKLTFRTMLDGSLVPGGLCSVQTESIDTRKAKVKAGAIYFIDRVTHSKDTSGTFATECEVREYP